MEIRPIMVDKFGGNVETVIGDTFARFHPKESAAIIVCNEELIFVKENNSQDSFALWKWQKIDDVKSVDNIQWNVSVSQSIKVSRLL